MSRNHPLPQVRVQSLTVSRKNRLSLFISAAALAAAFASIANADARESAQNSAPSIEMKWQAFQDNPVQFMNSLPPKKVIGTATAAPAFSRHDIAAKTFIEKKKNVREVCDESGVCLKDVLEGRAGAKEDAREFFDLRQFSSGQPVFRLDEMETAGLLTAELEETPWSDTYWPIYKGVLGARYTNESFTSQADWKGYYEYVSKKQNTLAELYGKGEGQALNNLSPSEKYDLLIGDLKNSGTVYEAGYLTPHMWSEGKVYWDERGEVEPWMGICHGWAPAAYMLPRPKKAITVAAADGKTKLKFYPSDIKGLSSYLWAKSGTPSRFIGGRCNSKDVKTDNESGRILDEKCFDANPANWHTIIVNQIGVAKKSFVMDATFDYEVWNQPVYSYEYRYFNPETGKPAETLEKATVSIPKFKKDKFKKFRSPKATSVVGIEMDVVYVVETEPSHKSSNSPNQDARSSVTYMYDLELDADGNIVGGEWYTNAHPDFMWTPAVDRAASYGDSRITPTDWDGKAPLPAFWRDIAVQTAVRTGVPLAGIVEGLISAANQ